MSRRGSKIMSKIKLYCQECGQQIKLPKNHKQIHCRLCKQKHLKKRVDKIKEKYGTK